MKFTRRSMVAAASVAGLAGCRRPRISARSATPSASDHLLVYQTDLDGGNGIWVMQTDGITGNLKISGTAQIPTKHPSWMADGLRVLYVGQDAQDLWIVDADGSNVTQIYTCSADCTMADYPACSPDGKRIAFTGYGNYSDGPPESSKILILDLESGEVKEVAEIAQPWLLDVPRWSPDGQTLVVGVDQFDEQFNESGSAIATVPATGGDLTYLTEFDEYAYAPDWSRESDLIVYSLETKGYSGSTELMEPARDLFTVRPDGTARQQVTHLEPKHYLFNPRWVPGVARLTATEDLPGDRRGVWIDAQTGEVTPISNTFITRPEAQPI